MLSRSLFSKQAFYQVSRVSTRAISTTLAEPFSKESETIPFPPSKNNQVQKTTLANGLTVISVDAPTNAATLGLYINAGAEYETAQTAGAGHLLRYLRYFGTKNLSGLRITRLVESTCSDFSVSNSKKHISYQAVVGSDNVKDALELIAETTQPELDEWQIRDASEYVAHDIKTVQSKEKLIDNAYLTAFRGSGHANPTVCPASNLANLTPEVMQKFVKEHYTTPNMTLVGVGAGHDQLVHYCESVFGGFSSESVQKPATSYVGGQSFSRDGNGVEAVVAYPIDASNAVVNNVIGKLLGSYHYTSAYKGAPIGSGVTSKIFKNVIAPNDNINAGHAFGSYEGQLTAVYGQASSNAQQLVDAIQNQFTALTNSVSAEELEGAKARCIQHIDEVYNNSQMYNKFLHLFNGASAEEVTSQFKSVSVADVNAAAKKMLSNKPTITVAGDVSGFTTVV